MFGGHNPYSKSKSNNIKKMKGYNKSSKKSIRTNRAAGKRSTTKRNKSKSRSSRKLFKF
tara:strand:+ start:14308 stop:14484 length:177 start_codon:yes stop_codon:yes gene_type:complete